MTWIIVSLVLILFVVTIYVGTSSMKIPREPWREGKEDRDAILSYESTSRWPIFTFERCIILNILSKQHPEGLLVDLGCGPGYLVADIVRNFPSLQVIGVDINEATINIACRRWQVIYPKMAFLLGDAQKLPFSDNTVDFLVTSLSVHHWADAFIGISEIHRVLKPGGQLLIFDLRRDGWKGFFFGLKIGQALFAPKPIKRTNGAVGSFQGCPGKNSVLIKELGGYWLEVKNNLLIIR
jgi:ubiquinone/menaquinone biosynthesis C-methylase UbiE